MTNMRMMVLGLLFFSYGCAEEHSFEQHTVEQRKIVNFKTVKCSRAVEYQGYEVTLTGLDLPLEMFGGQNKFHIGRLEFKPEKVREASDLIGVMDLMQFSDCQTMLLLTDQASILSLAQHRNSTITALAETMKSLDKSSSEEEHDKARAEAKKKRDELLKSSATKVEATRPDVSNAPVIPTEK